MMKASRGNRLSTEWRCPHCGMAMDTRAFRFAPGQPDKLLCPAPHCGRPFPWRRQNRGKLWPEQRAYAVLR